MPTHRRNNELQLIVRRQLSVDLVASQQWLRIKNGAIEPVYEALDSSNPPRIAVDHQPEGARDSDRIWQKALKARHSVGDETGQHAKTGTVANERRLRIDTGTADAGPQPRIDLREIIEFRRIDEVGNVADEWMID